MSNLREDSVSCFVVSPVFHFVDFKLVLCCTLILRNGKCHGFFLLFLGVRVFF